MSTYDLSGVDPDFLREDVRFAVFEANQRLFLNEPAFANSIEVVWLDGGTNPVLVEGVQWRTTYEDRDYAAMSEAKLIDGNFSEILVKSIENLDVPASTRVYAVQYQALKLKPSQEDPGTDGPNATPGLLTELITDVNFLKNVKNPLSDYTSDSLDGIKVLQEDVTGVNPSNFIEDERHFVDVPNNKMFIRTAAGPFWQHDVVVTNVNTGLPLVEGTDYKFVGWDKAKQLIAEHPSTVWNYIFLLTPLVGNVDVTYRAFGGEATLADISAIKDVLTEITNILVDGDLLSEESLPYTNLMVDIVTRLNELEDAVRHYATATHQIQADTDGLHWFTIANLYRDVWDTDVLKTGQVHLTLRNWTKQWNYDVLIAVNINDKQDKLKVKTIASADVSNTFDIGRYEELPDRNVPMLRACWNDDGVSTYASGVQIQIGLDMTALQTQVLTVYDRSGSGSDFNIRDHVVGTDTVYDDNVELPNGEIWEESYRGQYLDSSALNIAEPVGKPGWWASVAPGITDQRWWWNEGNTAWENSNDTSFFLPYGGLVEPVSKVDYVSILPQEGYLAFAGNIPMDKIQDPSHLISNVFSASTVEYNDIRTAQNIYPFNVSRIKRVTIKVYDRFVDQYIVKSTEVEWSTGLITDPTQSFAAYGKCDIMFFPDDLCSLYFAINRDVVMNAHNPWRSITVISNIGSHSIANERFDLREIVFNGQ